MQTKNKILFLFILTYLFPCCSGKQTYAEINPGLQIQRFDCDLYHYLIDNEPDSCLNKDSAFLNEFGKNVIRIGLPDSSGFYDRLKNFFSEPTLMKLYRDEQEKFTDISSINQELADGMAVLLQHFPALKQPELYFHVSGLNQNVIVTDDLLSISADKYMGVDYPLYQDFFYDYQRQLMSPDRIVPDALLGFLTANFHFKGKHEILLDNIVYQGKLRYFISQLLPERKIWEYVGYNAEQYAWCSSNEARIWKFILENKHLYTLNYRTTEQYLQSAPHTPSLPVESPGRVGEWLGFQIVKRYMKNHPHTSWEELMGMVDYQKFLKDSKYKP